MFIHNDRPIYEVGDVVTLTSIRPSGWNNMGNMDHFLGTTVTLTGVDYKGDHSDYSRIFFEGSEHWTFRLSNIASLANPDNQRATIVDIIEKLKGEGYLCTPDEIYEVAKETFGEDRVDILKRTDKAFELYVFFPEITITNSAGFSHDIKELYVRFDITLKINSNRVTTELNMYGRRGTISDYEFVSDYGHSHFSGLGMSWSHFCLGSSDFGMILQSMRLDSKASDWELMLLSLENYVSWESLEGGPYRRMQNISIDRNIDMVNYRYNAFKLFAGIPSTCLTFSDNKVQLIENHPELYKYYDEFSPLKSFESASLSPFPDLKHSFDTSYTNPDSGFRFKGVSLKRTLYQKETSPKDNVEQHVSLEVVNYYNNILKQELEKYNSSYGYYKNRKPDIFFREAAVI